MTLFDQISEDIKAAMKARDKVRLETLRNIKKVFLEAKTAPGANDTLDDADALKIISKLDKGDGPRDGSSHEENGWPCRRKSCIGNSKTPALVVAFSHCQAHSSRTTSSERSSGNDAT